MSLRIFFADEQGLIERIPVKTYEEWRWGLPIPRYRNQKVGIAVFYGEAENRQLSKILHASFSLEPFDSEGRRESQTPLIERLSRRQSPVPTPQYTQTSGVRIECSDWVPTQEQVNEFYKLMFSERRMKARSKIVHTPLHPAVSNNPNVGAY